MTLTNRRFNVASGLCNMCMTAASWGFNMHSCPVTHLVYARFQINMSPQTHFYLFLQLTIEQLVDVLRNEADDNEYVYCYCES